MKSHLFKISLVLLPFIFSCNDKKEKSGDGDCQYRDKSFPARLIELLDPADSSGKEGLFEVDFSKQSEKVTKVTVSYMKINKRLISDSEIEKNNVVVGKTYKYIQSTSEDLACEPITQRIELTEY